MLICHACQKPDEDAGHYRLDLVCLEYPNMPHGVGEAARVLCLACSMRLIDKHPRLYAGLDPNEPAPGCMAICLDCRHRDGTRCANPAAKINGGPGVEIFIAKPSRMHVCRSPRRLSGWVTSWKSPARDCTGKEVSRA